MYRFFIIFVFFIYVSELFPGWVAGRVFYKYIGGIPPAYHYDCHWNVPTSQYAGKVFLSGSQGVVSANIGKNCEPEQYIFSRSYNITGYKLYAVAFREISPGVFDKHAGLMTVNSNGDYQDFYLHNYNNVTVRNVVASLGYGWPYPNPFGSQPDHIYLEWEYPFEPPLTRFSILRRVNGGTWTEIAIINPNQFYYADLDVTIGNNYEYRVRGALVMPDHSDYIFTNYAETPVIGFSETPWISGPSSVNANQYSTWTGNPSNGEYEWRFKYSGQPNWSGVIGTSRQLSFNPSSNFSLQLKVTFGIVSKYTEKSITVLYQDEDVDVESIFSEAPNDYQLYQNFPNPFNPSTKIYFYLPEDSYVRIKLYDLLGREITLLVDKYLDQGFQSVEFNSSNISSGVYLYKMEAGNKMFTKKMIINK